MSSKGEQDVGGASEELLGVEGAAMGDPCLLPLMHRHAHHVPGCEGGSHQAQEGEGAVVLEGGQEDCQQRYQPPHNGPSPAALVMRCCTSMAGAAKGG